jgi:hypothetical protein
VTGFGDEGPQSFCKKGILVNAGDAREIEAFRLRPRANPGGQAGPAQKSRSAYCGPGAMPRTVSASSGRNDGLDFNL